MLQKRQIENVLLGSIVNTVLRTVQYSILQWAHMTAEAPSPILYFVYTFLH